MMKINTDAVMDASSRINRAVSGMNRCVLEIDRVVHDLSTLSGMESSTRRLQKINETNRKNARSMVQSRNALEDTCELYRIFESRIIDYCEDTVMKLERKRIKTQEIGDVAGQFRDLFF